LQQGFPDTPQGYSFFKEHEEFGSAFVLALGLHK
jgi:hypothetical protein